MPVKAGKSPWGMTEEQKWRREGGRKRERESEAANEEGRLARERGGGREGHQAGIGTSYD